MTADALALAAKVLTFYFPNEYLAWLERRREDLYSDEV